MNKITADQKINPNTSQNSTSNSGEFGEHTVVNPTDGKTTPRVTTVVNQNITHPLCDHIHTSNTNYIPLGSPEYRIMEELYYFQLQHEEDPA